jgi:hypothetical protein
MKIISLSVDVSKFARERIVTGKNGGKWMYLDLILHEEADRYGNHGFVKPQSTKQERESKARLPIIGNAKVVFEKKSGEKMDDHRTNKPGDDPEIPF